MLSSYQRSLGILEGYILAQPYVPSEIKEALCIVSQCVGGMPVGKEMTATEVLERWDNLGKKKKQPDNEDQTTHAGLPHPPLTEAQPELPKKRPWSPEARAADSERMKARQAEKAKKESTPRPDTDAEKLIADHPGYVGQRDDATLVDEDYGDIMKMRSNGLPDVRIAKSYGVTEDYLQRFIDRMWHQEFGDESGNVFTRESPGAADAISRETKKKKFGIF